MWKVGTWKIQEISLKVKKSKLGVISAHNNKKEKKAIDEQTNKCRTDNGHNGT